MYFNKKFFVCLVAIFWVGPVFGMQELSTKERFIEDIAWLDDFESRTPIKDMISRVDQEWDLLGRDCIGRVINLLDDDNDMVKKKASLALAIMGSRDFAFCPYYKKWAGKVKRENFLFKLAPGGSKIFIVGKYAREGSMAYVFQPGLKTSLPTRHKTITENWLFLKGMGEVALRPEDKGQKTKWAIHFVKPGIRITVPVGTAFQFRATTQEPLVFAVMTMPPYPDNDEDIDVPGLWERTHISLPADKFSFMKNLSFTLRFDGQNILEELHGALVGLVPGRNKDNVTFKVIDSPKVFLCHQDVFDVSREEMAIHFVLDKVEHKDLIVGTRVQSEGKIKITITRGFFNLSKCINMRNPEIDLVKVLMKIRLKEASAICAENIKPRLLGIFSALAIFAKLCKLSEARQERGVYPYDDPSYKRESHYAVVNLEETRLDLKNPAIAKVLLGEPLQFAEDILFLAD